MTSAMYYPHIHFRNRKWLRTALLHYDEIIRIVPEGYDPNSVEEYARFSYEAEELAAEVRELEAAGFICNVAPDPSSVNLTSGEFLDFVSSNLTDPDRRRSVLPLLRRRNPWLTLHPSKIDPGLAEILTELGLARKSVEHSPDDWDIEAATAVLYLMYLAARMADGRPLTTDNVNYQKLLYSRDRATEIKPAAARDDLFMLASASFESALPDNLEDLPLNTLLDFRDKHGAVRAKFQAEIGKLAEKMSEARDEHDLYKTLLAQAEMIAREEALLKDKLSFSFATFSAAVFSVSVPSYIVPVATGHPLLLAAAGAAVISLASYRYMLDRRVTQSSSPYAYLLAVDRLISRDKVARDLISLHIEPDDYDDRALAYF
jgi:hypothetical protein